MSPRSQSAAAPSRTAPLPSVEMELPAEAAEQGHFGVIDAVLALVFLALVAFNSIDPLRLPLKPFFNRTDVDKVKQTASATRLHAVDAAILLYYHLNGKLPDRLEDLVSGNCLPEEELLDAWSRPYDYQVDQEAYKIMGHRGDGSPDVSLIIQRELQQKAASLPASKQRN